MYYSSTLCKGCPNPGLRDYLRLWNAKCLIIDKINCLQTSSTTFMCSFPIQACLTSKPFLFPESRSFQKCGTQKTDNTHNNFSATWTLKILHYYMCFLFGRKHIAYHSHIKAFVRWWGRMLISHTPWKITIVFLWISLVFSPGFFPYWQLPNFFSLYILYPLSDFLFPQGRSCPSVLPLYHLVLQKQTLSFWFSFFLPETISAIKNSPQDTVFWITAGHYKQQWFFCLSEIVQTIWPVPKRQKI